ncbi:hypothetical protein Tsubulata_016812 [Turnera subulata]|uniref:Phospholipid/glycerol acyltransferase domain-containing protein n=1 Tax=Turnera subulata TaxID=218843 RepID=A0A9Q0F4Z3_9ROSI|nr:hypothetical protein Tsubulata_016812 [Turnera subulata]
MARNLFNLNLPYFLSKIMTNKACNKVYVQVRTTSNSHASHTDVHKFPFPSKKQQEFSNQDVMFQVEGTLLKSSSLFPYFMLVAFEAGGPLRALVLLLLYPLVCLAGGDIGLKVMVFVSFVGVKVESFKLGRTVLPKFFLEDVGHEGFDMVMRCGKKVGVSELPRVMVDVFLRHYLGVEFVVARELKVVCGYFAGLMEAKKESEVVLSEILRDRDTKHEIIGLACSNKSLDHQLFSHCKAVYLVSEAEKRTWEILPREKYKTPLIFHDGRLAFRPTPLAALAMLIWIPFGFLLFLIRITLGKLLPYEFSIPILALTGMRSNASIIPKSLDPEPSTEAKSRGILYVCNHRSLFDPVYVASVIRQPLTAVTYSLSRFSEVIAPIGTARLTRNREKDFKLIQEVLSQGNLVLCPEGTTCREPYLLRFSPLFAELSDHIVPVAIDTHVSMFYPTTACGFKCLDSVFFLMNPFVTTTIKILEKLPESVASGPGAEKSKFEVANYVQAQIAKALEFECTSFTRKDKYIFLADNDGKI